jgi:hypothetical protein
MPRGRRHYHFEWTHAVLRPCPASLQSGARSPCDPAGTRRTSTHVAVKVESGWSRTEKERHGRPCWLSMTSYRRSVCGDVFKIFVKIRLYLWTGGCVSAGEILTDMPDCNTTWRTTVQNKILYCRVYLRCHCWEVWKRAKYRDSGWNRGRCSWSTLRKNCWS